MHSVEDVRDAEALFVTDFSHIAQFNDPDQKRKHAPNVVGFFCYNNDTDKLKPVAIHVVDTKLTYSPYDTQEEWTLAKMALNAAEINYQQIHHMVETHMAFVPMKVEMMRTMAPEHPVHALVAHHLFTDLSVQFNAGKMLFSPNTTLDNTFAFGAVGSLRFVAHDLPRVSFADDFPAEVERRGWNKIPTHRYTAYGTQFYDLLKTFVDGYLSVYYASDVAVQRDFELQNWAKQTATNIDTYDFPESFESLESLSKLLTHVVFQHAFKHHAMNGRVSWETIALPYSAPAIWKEMPTFKTKHGKKHINLLEYVPPQSNIMDVMKVATMYYRPVPEEVTLLKAYRVAPFSQVTELQPHVNEPEAGLRELDSFVVSNEATKDHPYDLLRPAALPYFAWI
ncbi:TPA: hypothetical protein N0F65_012824 [Lagenidium giganteum]|uniref:Lipoxygenase domain-containing protein n=1 Tax=Lagenidium giganteum TaxID=4803 RepID=A0AAV2YIL2_9STRA|nr:TPA: hypothetical protein N0F65_012824 [Lagenidium giganteum]